MSVYINPGTGPIGEPPNETDAWNNMVKLCEDAGVLGKLDMPRAIERNPTADYGDGRIAFLIRLDERVCEVQMPAITLDRVRHIPGETNIWDFPRLYVDGSSWVWPYAVEMVQHGLLEEQEEL